MKNNYKIESLFYLIKHYTHLFFVCKIDSKSVFLSPDFGKAETVRSPLLPGVCFLHLMLLRFLLLCDRHAGVKQHHNFLT